MLPQASPAPEPTPDHAPQGLPNSVPELLERVREAQRREVRREASARGWTAAIALAIAALLTAAVSRTAGVGLAVAALLAYPAVTFGWGRAVARRRVGDLARTARWVGQRVPSLSFDWLGAVELEAALGRTPAFSAELARAHLQRLSAQAGKIDWMAAVDARGARRARGVLLATLVATAALVIAVPERLTRGAAALRPTRGVAGALERPSITGEVELTYRYPAHTGLAQRTVPGTNGEVNAPAGTEVFLRTRSDRSTARAALVIDGKTVPLRVAGDRELSGSFVATQSGSYRFVFSSSTGRVLAEGPELPIRVEADAPPTVSLLTPAQDIEVKPDERLTLKYQAQDDYGLSKLELVYQRRGSEQRLKLPLSKTRRASGQHGWELASLALEPGEVIRYTIEAEDNDAVSGPKRAGARSHVLKVYSAAEHQREALARAEALWEKLVRHLADRMEGPDRAKPPALEAIGRAMHTDDSGWRLHRELLDGAALLRREKDSPPGIAPALSHVAENLADRLRPSSEARRDVARDARLGRLGNGLAAGKLAHAVEEEIASTERDVLYLESLLQQHRLAALKQLARKLEAERRQLAARLEEYRRSPDPAVQKALLEQIQGIRQRLTELMRQYAQLARGLSDEHLSEEALAADRQNLTEELNKLEELVKEGKADEALAKLQELNMQMGELERSIERGSAGGSASEDPQLTADVRAFKKELEETADAQKKAADRTKAIRDRYRTQRQKMLAQKGAKLREQLSKETAALSREYRSIPPSAVGYPSESGRALEQAQTELDNLDSALKAEDFDLASEAAQRVRQAAHQLGVMGELQEQRDVYLNAPPDAQGQSREMAQRLRADAERAAEIERQLDALFPRSGAMMSEADRQSLKGMAKQQQELGKRTEGLRKRAGQLRSRAPIFGKDADEQLEAVQDQMGQAEQSLGAENAGRAHGEQRAAAEGLQDFAERLGQAMKNASGGGGGMPMPMADREGGEREDGFQDMSRSRVEIPEAEDSQAPREFRKDLLEAMKQGVPERYRDQVKRYYEELVQ